MVGILFVTLILFTSAMGQSYGFSVPQFHSVVKVNQDMSLDIGYDIEFTCSPGHHPIDIVDIGFPSDDYDLHSVHASIDEQELWAIYPSEYIETGVEIHLGSQAIYPGESGTLTVSGNNPRMVYLDSEVDDYASVEFTPTWFDGNLLSGSSNFSLTMIFPPGALPEDVRFHSTPFTESLSIEKSAIWSFSRNPQPGTASPEPHQ